MVLDKGNAKLSFFVPDWYGFARKNRGDSEGGVC